MAHWWTQSDSLGPLPARLSRRTGSTTWRGGFIFIILF